MSFPRKRESIDFSIKANYSSYMLEHRTRRLELGKTLLDIFKYVLTIVVIGGLAFGHLDDWVITLGIILSFAILFIGLFILPEDEKQWEN